MAKLFLISQFMILSVVALAQEHEKPMVHFTSKGIPYVRDNAYPEMGEAYRDPRGLIWSEELWVHHFIKGDKSGGKETYEGFVLDQKHARHDCKLIHARLPTKEEFLALHADLGGKSDLPDYKSGADGRAYDVNGRVIKGRDGYAAELLGPRFVGSIYHADDLPYYGYKDGGWSWLYYTYASYRGVESHWSSTSWSVRCVRNAK